MEVRVDHPLYVSLPENRLGAESHLKRKMYSQEYLSLDPF